MTVTYRIKHTCPIFIASIFFKDTWNHVLFTENVMGHKSWQFQTGNDPNIYQKSNKEADIVFIGQDTTQNKNQGNVKHSTNAHRCERSMYLKITNEKNNLGAK